MIKKKNKEIGWLGYQGSAWEKAKALAGQGEWTSFVDVLALLMFGIVLFLNVDGLVDLTVIDAFLAYQHSKESLIVVVLANAYDTFDR